MSTLTAVLWPETSPLAPRPLPWTPTQAYVPDTVPDTPESVPEREATRLAPTPVPPTPDSPRVQEEARPDRSAATPLFVPASPLVVADTPAAVHQQELTVAPRSAQPARRLFAEPYVSPAELKFREIILKQQQSFDTRAPLQTYTPHERHRAAAPRPPLQPVQDEVVVGDLVARHVAGRGQCVFAARENDRDMIRLSLVLEDGADASAAETAAIETFKLHARIRADEVSIVAELPENAELIVNQKDG